ncbi:hypothetical protein B0H19DRAFT_1383581 [Mycena capillaripes]|nr:hypothetical protein B0H19DRAFT_1383581 [Mycena capillaripes]
MDPKFPPELEQKIFELASALHPLRSMPKFLQVAQRVKTCQDQALICRVLSIAAGEPGLEPTGDDAVFILRHPLTDIDRLLASKPESSSLRENVRHIRFPSSCFSRQVTQLLSVCNATVDVVLPMHTLPGSISKPLQPLPLQRLVFTRLTHLEFRDWREHDETLSGWQGLALIPRLTYLCFHELDSMIPIIMLCLQHCKFLEVLVVACSTLSHIEMTRERLDSSRDMLPGDPLFLVLPSQPLVTTDPRFLVLLVPDYYHDVGWEAFARGGGEDFWAAADRHGICSKAVLVGFFLDYVAGFEN